MENQTTSPAHTAGPWEVHNDANFQNPYRIIGANGELIANFVVKADKAKAEANADLISKAWLIPELVASLKAMIEAADEGEIFNHDHSGCEDCILCDARKVIAKAA